MEKIYSDIQALFGLDEPCPLTDKQIADIREHFGGLPKTLETYYQLCGGCEPMNSAQDFLLTADKQYGNYDLKRWNYDDYCVFYVENQCVSVWAFKKSDIDKDDPPVYETYDDGKTWYETCGKMSKFLISHAYLHAVFSFEVCDEDFFEADEEQVQEIAEKFPHANADSQLYTGVQFYQPYPDTVISVMKNGEDGYQVMFASQDEEHYDEIADILYDIFGYEE
ncbi:MAG: hypothetical protein IJ779_07660 [Ruminococcus sp.]|nr:hypothetical protein [Ruminococcus sp.]